MTLNIIDKCLHLQSTLNGQDLLRCTRQELTRTVLNGMSQMGFDGVRFYDVVFNVPRNDDILILSDRRGAGCEHLSIGYTIDFRASTLARKGVAFKSVVDDYVSIINDGNPPSWVNDINLIDKSWVDIPLYYGDMLLGVISCDWRGVTNDLSPQQLSLLDMMGSLIAAKLNMIPSELLDRARTKLFESVKGCDNTIQLLETFLDLTCSVFDVAISAAFRYEWDTHQLRKVCERPHPDIKAKCLPFDELYNIGEYLTGQAWLHDEYKYIVNFSSLVDSERDKHKVYLPSHARHTALLGKLTSTYYHVVGKREQQYLLRFMNRADDTRLPLLPAHTELINKLCVELSDVLDDANSSRRLTNLQRISRTIVQNLGAPNEVIRTLAECMLQEGFPHIAILCHADDGIYYSHYHYFGSLFAEWRQTDPCPWRDDEFYMHAITANESQIYELGSIDGHNDPKLLIGYLYERHIRRVLAIPFTTAHGRGLLACPLSPSVDGSTKPAFAALKKHQPGKCSIIATYANSIGNIIDAADSHLTAEGAQKLIAHIGHEVTTPASIIGQTALEAIYRLGKELAPGSDAIAQLFKSLVKDIKKEMQTMGTTMQVATMVAQQNQRLRIHFRLVDLGTLIHSAADTVQQTFTTYDPDGNLRAYKIIVAASCARLGSIVCDEDLMKMVFMNLLKNAVKYSLPRYKQTPMEITVIGQPQTGMSIVQCADWGFGIPPNEYEHIFRPYVRGSVTDTKKAIRGMGLGLYIARRIMTAHRGSVCCTSSVQKLDYATHRGDWEGYETVFEIRIPHTLKEGVAEYAWKDWV